jgi:hypothetical protein
MLYEPCLEDMYNFANAASGARFADPRIEFYYRKGQLVKHRATGLQTFGRLTARSEVFAVLRRSPEILPGWW